MGLFKNLKVMKGHMVAGFHGEGPTAEALASMTPEQRAAYDANMARVAAAQAEASTEHTRLETQRLGSQALRGPAGEYVYGPAPDTLTPEQIAAMSAADMLAHSMQQTKDGLKDVLKNPFGGRKAPPPPTATAGPVDRAAQSAAERAVRDEARAGSLRGEKGGVVEWDVVHATSAALTPVTSAPAAVAFRGEEQWVARRPGEPSVLDEDLVLAYLAQAGIGPEQCLGIARHLSIRNRNNDDGTGITLTHVTGVHAFHPAGMGGAAIKELSAARPLPLETGPPSGVHVAVLNWRDIARAIHPETNKPYAIPSPFPYLPSTAQELVRSYLEIVGVQPADCYSAQVTEDKPRDIRAIGSKLGGLVSYNTNTGEKQPCADGKDRPRLAGGSVVVVAYRDRDAYGAGRERWAAYERDVLQASLASGTGLRRSVQKLDYAEGKGLGPSLLRTAERVASVIEFFDDDPIGESALDTLAPHRYCWPPASGR